MDVSGPLACSDAARRQRRPFQRSISGAPGALPAPNATAWPTAKHSDELGHATASRRLLV